MLRYINYTSIKLLGKKWNQSTTNAKVIILSGKSRAVIKVHIFIGKCQKIKIQQVCNFQISRESRKTEALHLNSSKGCCGEVINNQSKPDAQNSGVSPNKSNYNNPKLNLTLTKHCQSKLKIVCSIGITPLLTCMYVYTKRQNTKISHTYKMEMTILEKYLTSYINVISNTLRQKNYH